ncbi:MAG TPA: hypothetical protein VF221_07680 [Chloroflexota bacterium]
MPCRPIAASSATVRSCQLKGHGFASVEPIRISYTLEIPVRPELVAIHPTPKLWGLEPPRVQCLTTRPNACVRDRTSEGGVFGPLLVHLTSLKLPYAGGAAEQHFRVTVRGAKGDQATIVLPNSIVHADGPVRR